MTGPHQDAALVEGLAAGVRPEHVDGLDEAVDVVPGGGRSALRASGDAW